MASNATVSEPFALIAGGTSAAEALSTPEGADELVLEPPGAAGVLVVVVVLFEQPDKTKALAASTASGIKTLVRADTSELHRQG